MGKKSKRSRGGGSFRGGGTATAGPKKLIAEDDAAVPPPKKMPAAAAKTAAAIVEEDEETADNLRFEDPFDDEYEEEDMMDDDDANDDDDDVAAADEKMHAEEAEGGTTATTAEATAAIRSWNPLTSDPLPPGTKLEIDESAYKMHHALTPEWPALSFDFIRDDLGDNRTRFPHSAIVAVGSQADRRERNKLTVMKLSDLSRTGKDKSGEEEDDEILGEEYNPDDDDGSDDDDDEEEEEELADLDPVVEHYSLRHPSGGINRVRVMPQHPEVVATWSDSGTVELYDVRGILDAFERSSGGGGGAGSSNKIRRDPFFVYQGHSTEGYAMDWSKVKAGQMATGDCDGNIHLWQPAEGGGSSSPFGGSGGSGGGNWSNSSFRVSAAYGPSGGNIDCPSVEDIQWSPTESTVLATAECGGYVKVYDTRCRDRPMICDKVHANGSDVNVLAWNGLVSNLLATGADDGVLTVWDLRNFQSKSGGGSASGTPPPPLARFTAHRNPITSLEWHPTDESMIAVSDEAGTYVYDLSVEEDEPTDPSNKIGNNIDDDPDGAIPPQLLFVHCGSTNTKEVHWHPQVTSMMMATALDGFSVFIPSNL